MRKTNLNTYMAFTTIFLFFSLLFFSPVLAETEKPFNNIDEKNNNRPGIITFWRGYYYGKINNLTKVTDTYQFKSNNMRHFLFSRDSTRTWEISYMHYRGDWLFTVHGFKFRGILTSTFICGVFYG
jgi:hypothetical protein